MMSVHSPTVKPSAVRLDSCTVICIWNIWEPSRPQKVLVYESDVRHNGRLHLRYTSQFKPTAVEAAGFVAATGAVLLLQPRQGHAGVRRDLGGLRAAVGPEGAGEQPLPPDDRAGGVDLPAAHLLHWCVTEEAVAGVRLDRILIEPNVNTGEEEATGHLIERKIKLNNILVKSDD